MANSKSAEKRIRQNEKRRVENRAYVSGSRTAIRRARTLINSGDENATEAVHQALKALDRAASKGVIHPKNAARRKSRLMQALHQMAA